MTANTYDLGPADLHALLTTIKRRLTKLDIKSDNNFNTLSRTDYDTYISLQKKQITLKKLLETYIENIPET